MRKRTFDALCELDFIKSMQDQLHEITRHNVWTLRPRPENKRNIGIRWVYRNTFYEN